MTTNDRNNHKASEQLLSQPHSIWNLKPWWCQPWSILLAGCTVALSSWLISARWWVTAPVVLGVLLWWWLFLVIVPMDYMQQQEKN